MSTAATQAMARSEAESTAVVTDRTRATLVADAGAVIPGKSLPVALHLQLKQGWHTYWRNPGDSGEPAVVTLHVEGRDIKGPDIWPTPERIDLAGIVSYGHHGDVVLTTTLPVPADLKAGTPLQVEAQATWLVCDKVCVPEQGHFTLSLPVTAPATTMRDGVPALHPPPLPAASGVFSKTEQKLTLRVPLASLGSAEGPVTDAYFFPERGDQIDHSAPQVIRPSEGELAVEMTPSQIPAAPAAELRGVLAVTRQLADGTRQTRDFDLSARPATATR